MKLTREPWTCSEDDIRGLRAHGFKDEDILDAISVIGLFNHVDRVADATGITVNPGYYTMAVKPGVV